MNFPHDKNKPLFDQLKYEEQKSVSQLNVVLLLKIADMSRCILWNNLLWRLIYYKLVLLCWVDFLVFHILNWMTFTIYIASEHYLTSTLSYQYLCVYSTGIRNPEELSVMKFMDKDDLKKNIKEHLNTKKKRDSLHDQMPASNGVNHSNSGSLDRLSPYPNRSPAGPSPNVSTSPDFIGWCLDHCIANIKNVVIS